ncbi:NAD(+) kinase [Ectothiorhodospiraceae bacterium BW-2]|nr:NAD(+) kinase [Ectothiorhodospiraceae bacterium BW-2]
MNYPFSRIGIIGKFAAPTVSTTLQRLVDYLQRCELSVVLDSDTAEVWSDHGLTVVSRVQMGEQCDLVIVVGGDGTFLGAARSLCEYRNIALLGLNLGRLGFLTDISPATMELQLKAIFEGRYLEEERFLLHCSVVREGKICYTYNGFNDVVIHKREVARMIEIDIYIDASHITTMRADGLIVATPTGSTAYALSGGGPIIEPELNAMVLVPICPHTLSNRPVVIDADSVVEMVIKGACGNETQVSIDGQANEKLQRGDQLIIRKKSPSIRLIHPAEHSHFSLLKAKLGWG